MITRDATWVGLTQVARELGMTRELARKQLFKLRWVLPPEGCPPRWDARVIDLVRAMRGQPHRTLEPAHEDWLARYLEEPHVRDTRRTPRPPQPRPAPPDR